MFIEYCKLKRLNKFYLAYKELGDNGIGYFLKLIKLAKKEHVSVERLLKLADLADENNPLGLSQLEKRREWHIGNIHELDLQIERSKKYLNRQSNEIANARKLLSDLTISCKEKIQELEKIISQISRLLTLINRFKSNSEEYLKIKRTVEEEVNNVLIDGKVLLQFALVSVIEALRRNPDKYNDLLVFDTSSSTIATKQSPLLHIEGYKKIILDESKRIYDELLIYFTNSIMDNAARAPSSNSS